MKKLLLVIPLFLLLFACTKGGTLKEVDEGNNPNIEVYEYYYKDGASVFVAKFKESPILTTTWSVQNGKHRTDYHCVTIFENDSIKVILKK
jgi:hypothetical protein